MISIRLKSSYTEIDRFGNFRNWENSVEATGSSNEILSLLENTKLNSKLPGINSLFLQPSIKNSLLDYDD